jgi:tetratricopeptide (TPR) repeat protein
VSQLKKALKQQKIVWKDFRNEQKDEIIVAKTVNGIAARAQVTPYDKKMALVEIKASHVLIKIASDNQIEDIIAIKKAEKIFEAALSNLGSFSALAKQYSDDKISAGNGGALGWISRGQMVPEFEKQLYKMQPNEIIGPVKTEFGYHIIMCTGRKEKPLEAGMTEQQLEAQILQQKQQEAVRKWINPIQDSANIVIIDPMLLAYEYRVKQEYLRAALEYQKILSSQPQNLLLYVQIARMFEKLSRIDDAVNMYERAMVWQKYNPQYQYPIVYMSAIDFYKKHGLIERARTLASALLTTFKDKRLILESVSNNYTALLTPEQNTKLRADLEKYILEDQKAQKAAMAAEAAKKITGK